MLGAVKALDALNRDRGRPGAAHLRAHGVETIGEIGDLRLAGRVLKGRDTVGEGRGQHGVLGRADRDEGKGDVRALQPVRRFGQHITFVEVDLRAHGRQGFQMQVHGPRADGAAAGK